MLTELFSSNFFILVLLVSVFIILSGGIIIAIYYKPKEYEQTHFSIFVKILSSLGILIWALESMILAVSNQIALDRTLQNNYDRKIQSLFLEPFELFTNEKIRPEFAASFKYSNRELFAKTKDLTSIVTPEVIFNEDLVFNKLCEAFEDLLEIQDFQSNFDSVWIGILLEYSHSKFFQEKWKLFQFKYDQGTRDFVNLLIHYANQVAIPVEKPELYLEKAELLLKDQEFQKILSRQTR